MYICIVCVCTHVRSSVVICYANSTIYVYTCAPRLTLHSVCMVICYALYSNRNTYALHLYACYRNTFPQALLQAIENMAHDL